MSKIARLREIKEVNTMVGYYSNEGDRELVEEITEELLSDASVVHESFEDGGRWTNWKTEVFKLEEDGEVAYFRIQEEVPATEIQEGGDYIWLFQEVVPYEITVTRYVGV